MITRRKLITRAAAFIAAPAIVRFSSLMPINVQPEWNVIVTTNVSWWGRKPIDMDWRVVEVTSNDIYLHYYRPEDLGHGWKELHEALKQAQSPSHF